MKILITGAKGFLGKNLYYSLNNIRCSKDRSLPSLMIDEIFCYDVESDDQDLARFTAEADFIFHFAGVNRPVREEEFITGNVTLLEKLLNFLEKSQNTCPIVFASSIQATRDNAYGASKRMAEKCLRAYAERTNTNVMIYRFSNIFGKWCRPNYNSVVATFCYNIARDLPICIHDKSTTLNLLYIDDVVAEMIRALQGAPSHKNGFYYVEPEHQIKLGDLADLIRMFRTFPDTLTIPEMPDNSFIKKLFATYVSYLPEHLAHFSLQSHQDHRGCFTELFKSRTSGQVSVNVSKPGITKGEHWHDTKWEIFIVVYGHALIQQREIGKSNVWEFEVDGKHLEAVYMLPGYTHNIINLSDTEPLITIMWANETFQPERPDTYREMV